MYDMRISKNKSLGKISTALYDMPFFEKDPAVLNNYTIHHNKNSKGPLSS